MCHALASVSPPSSNPIPSTLNTDVEASCFIEPVADTWELGNNPRRMPSSQKADTLLPTSEEAFRPQALQHAWEHPGPWKRA